MTLTRVFSILGVTILLGATGYVTANATHRLAAQPTAVAVVDIFVVTDAIKEKMQIEADLQTKADEIRQMQETMSKELQALKSDLDILAPGTPAYEEKVDELNQKMIELDTRGRYKLESYKREYAQQWIRLYHKIVQKSGEVAKENGFDLVLFKETPIDVNILRKLDFRKVQDVGQLREMANTLFQEREVMWASDDIDLTDQVTQRMNNDFSNMVQ